MNLRGAPADESRLCINFVVFLDGRQISATGQRDRLDSHCTAAFFKRVLCNSAGRVVVLT